MSINFNVVECTSDHLKDERVFHVSDVRITRTIFTGLSSTNINLE